MEVAAGEDLFAKHQRVIGGGIELDRENAPRFGQRVPHRSVHLRYAAQGIGVLHAAAGDVRHANFAALEQPPQVIGSRELAGMRAGGMDALVESPRCSAEGVERESARSEEHTSELQ